MTLEGQVNNMSGAAGNSNKTFEEILHMNNAEKARYLSCELGLNTLPVNLSKKPKCKEWKSLQTQEITENQIQEWGAIYQNAELAVITGKTSNLTVIDADSPEALESILRLLPDSELYPIIDTPNGGGNIWGLYTPELPQFQLSKTRRGSVPPEERIDIRNDGGYAMLPGSWAYLKDANGKNTNRKGQYKPRLARDGKTFSELIKGRDAFSPELISFINETIIENQPIMSHLGQNAVAEPPESISIGQLNNMLFSRAWELVKGGKWPRQRIEEIILEANKVDCRPPLPEREVQSIINSAYKRLETHNPIDRRISYDDGMNVTFVRRKCSEIEDTPISWGWKPVVPMKMVTNISGDPGSGKTLITVDMTARISRGAPFPTYQDPSPPIKGSIIYISSEGAPGQILKPRLRAAQADLTKVDIIEGVYDGNLLPVSSR